MTDTREYAAGIATEETARRGAGAGRTAIALALLVALCGIRFGYAAIHTGPMLDEATFVRRMYVAPWRNDTYESRFYSIDLPAFARYAWRGAAAATGGWRWPEFDDAHYEFMKERPLFPRNIFPGEVTMEDAARVPRGPVYILRATNVAAMTAACVAVFLMARGLFSSAGAGFIAALPLLLHPASGRWMIGYPGLDAMLEFWSVTFLALWTRYHTRGTAWRARQVMTLAVVAGLAAATKINAGLLVVAFAFYLMAFGTRRSRWWLAPVFCAAAFAVFVATNPVLWQPGAGGLADGLRDIFARRAEVMAEQNKYLNVRPVSWYFATRAFLLPLAPAAIWGYYKARKETWLVPATVWGAVMAIGSYVTLNRYDIRLGMPMDVAIMTPVTLAVIWAVREKIRGTDAEEARL